LGEENEIKEEGGGGGGGNGLGRKPRIPDPSCVSCLYLAINRSHLVSFFVFGQTVDLIPQICDFYSL